MVCDYNGYTWLERGERETRQHKGMQNGALVTGDGYVISKYDGYYPASRANLDHK